MCTITSMTLRLMVVVAFGCMAAPQSNLLVYEYTPIRMLFNWCGDSQDISKVQAQPDETVASVTAVATGHLLEVDGVEGGEFQLPLYTEVTPFSERWYLLYSSNMSTATGYRATPSALLFGMEKLDDYCQRYAYVKWNSISVRITFQCPQAIVGYFAAAWAPKAVGNGILGTWTDYVTQLLSNEKEYFTSFGLRDNCVIVDMSKPSDLLFDIPWTHNARMLPWGTLTDDIEFAAVLGMFSVFRSLSSVATIPVLRVYAKFNGLECFSPVSPDDALVFEKQMRS